MAQEEPLFIHPAEVDPARFIGFRQEVPYAINGNKRAKETIKALGLDRENLNEDRRDHLKTLNTYQEILILEASLVATPEGRRLVAKARAFLSSAFLDSAKFAAMTRAAAGQAGLDL